MNHYPRHIGDWMKATAHLSDVEECMYSRLIDQYYSREGPIPVELAQACRLVRAITTAARKAVGIVLQEFFTLEADGWHQKRCDEELSKYLEKSAKASKSASARWSESHTERTANASTNAMRTHMRTQSEGNASQNQNQNRIPKKQSGGDFNHPTRPKPTKAPPLSEKKPENPAEKPDIPDTPHSTLAKHLRALDVEIEASDQRIASWIARGMTPQFADQVIAKARTRKGRATGPLPANLVALIIEDLLTTGPGNASPIALHSASEWWSTRSGVEAKANELGVAVEPNSQLSESENFYVFKAAVFVAAGDGPWIDPRDHTMQRIMDDLRRAA